jgi:hypothetical protein
MSMRLHELHVHELLASKEAEREQIARDIHEGVKSPEQIAAEHQGFGMLAHRAVMRLDLARQLS